MGSSGMEAWVTSAVDEKDVGKAILLAGSLRRVFTAKKLVVLTTVAVSQTSSEKLRRAFDLVIPVGAAAQNGLTLEDYAKVEACSLMIFNKCVYLSPNVVVLRNCDDIFHKYTNFALCDGEQWVDSSVYLFTPSQKLRKGVENAFAESPKSFGNDNILHTAGKTRSFAKGLGIWIKNNLQKWEKLDSQYNVCVHLDGVGKSKSLGCNLTIANFTGGLHPLNLLDGKGVVEEWKRGWGPVEHFVVQECRNIAAMMEAQQGLDGLAPDHHFTSDMSKSEPIAIVGMSFRLPGGNNVDELWDLLINGKEAIKFLPDSRWTREQTHIPCQNRKVEAGFLSIPVDEFDAKFFGISGKEAEILDPQQRLLLEVAWEALEDAMVDPTTLLATQTGIFVGSWIHDYKELVAGTTDLDFFRSYMGTSVAATSARLSHFLGTTGPSIATESGCSSAIVGVDMAVKSLRSRETNLALAGGVNLLLKPFDYNTSPVLTSPDGRCKTFDVSANGFGRAEGCAVLLMKRLSDAIRDEDNIWGLVRGSAITQEGVSKSFGTPTVHCESLAMKLALNNANVDPIHVSYVEAHGTGTPVGDPMEIAAITKAYSQGRSVPLLIGSVKTNVGHTESVSGITGIIKVLLSMKNETIPPHRNLKILNPAINLDAIPAKIPLEPVSWPKSNDKPRIAGVSSFGISGSDGHVIIQEPPIHNSSHRQSYRTDGEPGRPLHLMKLSAKSPESLEELLSIYEELFASKKDEGFADMAYSANIGRATFNHRAVIIATDFNEANTIIRSKSYKLAEVQSSGSQLCFLFTGQGSQYPNMGASLYSTSPIFRDEFNKCDMLLKSRYGVNLQQVLWGESSDGGNELSRTLYSQTSIFCIEYCLLKLWESWGVKPDYVMGHSLGEFAAAVAAGALDFEDALMLVAERSRLIDSLPRGKMLVIRADRGTVDRNIEEHKLVNPAFWVDYAAFNSPDQTVVAGDSTMIQECAKFCEAKSLKTIVLAATHAFHSRHMEPMLEAYRRVAQTVKPSRVSDDAPKFISGMDGKLTDLNLIDAEYWVRHTREPVRYIDACKVVQSEGCSLFLEVGPHPVLSALTMMNAGDGSVTCLPSIRKNGQDWPTILDSLAKLYLSDWKGQVNWKGFDRYYKRSRVSLPFYPFNRKPVRKDLEGILPITHPLLGRPIPTHCDHTIFESKLTLNNTPFIKDHVIGNTVIFPGAAFLEMCLAAGHAAGQGGISSKNPQQPVMLKSLRISSPLAMYDSGISRLQTTTKLEMDDSEGIGYSVGIHRYVTSASNQVGDYVTHATGKYLQVPARFNPNESSLDIPSIQNAWEETDPAEFYQTLPDVGLSFGPQFQSLRKGWKSERGMLTRINLPKDNDVGFLIHPIIADAMIQAIMLWTSRDKQGKMKLQVPVRVEEFIWLQSSPSPQRYLYCQTNEDMTTHCTLLDEQATPLARMMGVDFIETSVKLVEGMIQQQEIAMPKLWREVWKSSPGPLESAYEHIRTTPEEPFLEFDVEQQQILDSLNEVGEEETTFHEDLCKLARFFFLNAQYQLGWRPSQDTGFTSGELVGLLPQPKQQFRRYIQFFLKNMTEAGMLLEEVTGNERKYRFKGPPPTTHEIEKVLGQLVGPEDRSRLEYKLIIETGRSLPQIWLGKVNPLQILFPDNPAKANAGQFYNAVADWVVPVISQVNDELFAGVIDKWYNAAVAAPGKHNPPVFRLLEVGAGTGVLSEPTLERLARWGKPFEYHFTDISTSFFKAAEAKFQKVAPNLIFKKLDMEEDPLAQGFCPGYFDLILATEVLHVAKDIRKTVRNLKTLLKPGGLFQIEETTQPDPRITQIFGLLEGYWQFEDLELRPYHTTLSPQKWEQVLREMGCDNVVCKSAYNNVHTFITARLSPDDKNNDIRGHLGAPEYSWLIFYHEDDDGCNKSVAKLLRNKLDRVNRKVRLVSRPAGCTENMMGELMKTEFLAALDGVQKVEGVIYMWGLLDEEVSQQEQSKVSLPLINLAQTVMDSKDPPRLYLVTQGTSNVDGSDVTNPTAGTLHGMIKSVTNESTDLQLSCLDLSPDDLVAQKVENIFHELWVGRERSGNIAFRENGRLCTRFASARVNNNEPLVLPGGCDRFKLFLPTTKSISDLEFGPLEHYILGEDEIEVQVKATALNFRDIFVVIKPIKEFEDFNTVGLDFAGVVTKVGAKVTKRKIGDRVIGINSNRNLSLPSHVKEKEEFVVPLPTSFTFQEGVTLPAVFATAVLCLLKLAKMKRGDTVLIHTASGGVGLCAIQLAKAAGAEIFATAGSKRKQKYLRNLGVKHIFHSRTTDFGKQILEVTNGRGVDIVLNSITGEGFKEASLSALARNGRFIEMSKLNVWGSEEVAGLRPDVFYQVVDLMSLEKSEMIGLMEQLREYIYSGQIRALPCERFDAVNIRGALNYLQKAKHIGKIVCTMPEVQMKDSKISASTPLFNELSTYLITGGLGGIGLEVVKWMLRSGAKHVAIASRSPPKPEIRRQIESWNKEGKHVEAFSIDIGDADQCQRLFQMIKGIKGFPQLRGVMHAAGVIADAIMVNQNWGKFEHTYHPKVNGTWNLHNMTKELLLEHFVLFSSTAASIGSPGQSNHSASNSFEDAFASYRRSMGLPATSVNWGNWGEVGVATEIDFPGMRPITTSQGILALETFLRTQESHVTVANFESFALAVKLFPSLKSYLDDKRLFGEQKTTTTVINSDGFWKHVEREGDPQGRLSLFKDAIKSVLRNILKMDQDEVINDLADFQTLGVDSLMMLELKNGLQNILGMRMILTANQLKDCGTANALAGRLVGVLEAGKGILNK